MHWLERIMETLFPTRIYCMCCGSIIDTTRQYAICDHCIEKMNWLTGHTCVKCGKILEDGYRHDRCHDCRNRQHYFDRGYTCTQYGLYERALVMDMKYRDKSWICRKLGTILTDRIALETLDVDLVLPVPVHADRREERGYNQAELMSRPVAAYLDVPLETELLQRIVSTTAMKELSAGERIEAAMSAFTVSTRGRDRIRGKHLLLVDDIYTTGATMDGCSKVLKEAGAGTVSVLTFAAGGNVPPHDAQER